MPKITYTTNHKYEIAPYAADWPLWYAKEAALLQQIIGEAADIQHVGSTAIPGMAAKPQLDILVQVPDITAIDALQQQVEAADYVAYGDALKKGGRLFSRWKAGAKIINVHVFETGSPAVNEYISVRDFLRTHPEEAEKYAAFKLELYKKYPTDYLKYREYKDPYLEQLRSRIPQN